MENVRNFEKPINDLDLAGQYDLEIPVLNDLGETIEWHTHTLKGKLSVMDVCGDENQVSNVFRQKIINMPVENPIVLVKTGNDNWEIVDLNGERTVVPSQSFCGQYLKSTENPDKKLLT